MKSKYRGFITTMIQIRKAIHIRIIRISAVVVTLAAAGILLSQDAPDRSTWTDLEMVKNLCGSCHDLKSYIVTERSFKSWSLTVKRMQDYCSGTEGEYPDSEGIRMAKYLASDPKELQDMEDIYYTTPEPEKSQEPATTEPPAPIASQPSPAPVMAAVCMPVELRRKAPPGFRPPSRATGAARKSGYLAFVFMVLLAVTGFARRNLRKLFKPLHSTAALIVFVSLTVHVAIYLSEYGAPAVLWLWFGIIATGLIVLTEAVGIFRRQLSVRFIPVHAIFAIAGIVLTILHCVWIYI